MKEQLIGTFNMGFEPVRLIVREGMGGEFATTPAPTIWVGIQSKDWNIVHEALLHETLEFVAFRANARYNPDNNVSSSHESYVFMFPHSVFSDICAKTTLFTVPAVPLLRTAWEAYHSPRRSKKTARR